MDLTPQTNTYCNLEKTEGARPSPLSGMSGWQPIETAPTDGTDILTRSSRNEASVRYWGEGEDGDDDWQPRIRGCSPKWWMAIQPLD